LRDGAQENATAAAFRRGLEDRLQDIARKEGVDLQRVRRQVAFDRLLARLFQAAQPHELPWVLKGGYAMELRIKAARTTKDIDLTMRSVSSPGEKKDDKKNLAVLEKLQEATAFTSDDFFVYTIGEPISDLDAAPYGGARFPVEARLDGRVFVGFHLDVGIGDAVMEPLEVIEGRDWFLSMLGRDSRVWIPCRHFAWLNGLVVANPQYKRLTKPPKGSFFLFGVRGVGKSTEHPSRVQLML
jgi:hypothetical protein